MNSEVIKTSEPEYCGLIHNWKEEYYGYRCMDCDLWVPLDYFSK